MATKTKRAKRGRPSRRTAPRTRSRRPARGARRTPAPRTRVPVSIEPEQSDVEEEVKEDVDELEGDHGPQGRMGGFGGFSEVPE